MKSKEDERRSALVTRRSQLLELITQEKNRVKQACNEEIKQCIQETLILNSVVGVGPVTINRDSGKSSGKRFIGGGRSYVRRVLYMSTLAAIRHNPKIRALYKQFRQKGKEAKVAIIFDSVIPRAVVSPQSCAMFH